MKNLKSSQMMLVVVLLASITIISASAFPINEALAKPHASFVLVPDDSDPKQADANPILLVLGHSNEPAFGKLPGIHDGKHNVEVILEDNATLLPIQGNNETEHAQELELENTQILVDKFYFKDIKSFQNADSPFDADAIEQNVPVSAVFGQTGTFFNRQVIDPGIYGYTLKGVINYYGVANVPIPEGLTKFCSTSGEGVEETSKFDSPGWSGSFGCPQNIKSIFFPPASKFPDNNYPPNQYPQYGDDGYGDYQQQKQYLDNNNYYDKVRDDSRDNKKDDYKSDSRDNKRDDRNDEYKEYNDNNNYDDQYSYEYTDDDNGEYGNAYASYDEDEEEE